MKTATGNALLRAYSKAAKNLENDECLTSSATSAGFIIPIGQPRGRRKGFQVFVRVCKYSDELLAKDSFTGGLLCNANPQDL